jgi:hypothetical protein
LAAGLDWLRAVAREKGRATALFPESGLDLAMADRRPNALHDLGGVRPAGLRIGADLGVDGIVLKGVEKCGTLGRVERAMRDVLRGLGDPLEISSSSRERLRFADRLRV